RPPHALYFAVARDSYREALTDKTRNGPIVCVISTDMHAVGPHVERQLPVVDRDEQSTVQDAEHSQAPRLLLKLSRCGLLMTQSQCAHPPAHCLDDSRLQPFVVVPFRG